MRTLLLLAVVGLVPALAAAQTSGSTPPPATSGAPAAAVPAPADAPAPGSEGSAAPPAGAPAPPPAGYVYDPAGRRDPFASLIGTGAEPLVSTQRPDGAAGLLVNEISVRGVVESRGALVAAVQGPDNKTYLVRKGDKLFDGTIKAVTPEGLTIVQNVNDPLSIVKQREVQKLLRSLEDAK